VTKSLSTNSRWNFEEFSVTKKVSVRSTDTIGPGTTRKRKKRGTKEKEVQLRLYQPLPTLKSTVIQFSTLTRYRYQYWSHQGLLEPSQNP
jgi:hypothetical protein